MLTGTDISLTRATEIIKEIDFPTLPLYLILIQKELDSKQPSFPKIAGLVSQDMALTAKLLRTVNSAGFKTRSHIDNPLQALTILGQEQFYQYVLADSLKKALDNHALSESYFTILWKHSTQTANTCRFMADHLSRSLETGLHINSNHAYLAGLFHDCGIPIMAARFPNYETEMKASYAHGESLVEMENRLFDSDHSIICFLVAKMWDLPVPVRYAILGHHGDDLGYSGEQEHRELGVILRAAQSFLQEFLPQNNPIQHETITQLKMAELLGTELGIDEEVVEELFRVMKAEFAK